MGRVKYTKEFIPIDFFNSEPVDVIEKIFLTKSQEWNYEKEYRIFEVNTENERGWRKLNFIKEALQEVIFGCKINEDDKNDIIEIIKSKKYPKAIFNKLL